ncbi:MAG: single-stranded DNA-binding protein [Bdellovibrio sp.]|nr:single-stranded DNA-binding protein [Bdellovibrio sp.]
MEGSNRILIYGRIGQKPELRYTAKREAVCSFSVAENIPDSEAPKWHKVVVWGREAELCQAQLDKGLPIFVRGRNVDCEFKTKEGNLKKYTELRADRVGISIA